MALFIESETEKINRFIRVKLVIAFLSTKRNVVKQSSSLYHNIRSWCDFLVIAGLQQTL